jgi:hypothetical protein
VHRHQHHGPIKEAGMKLHRHLPAAFTLVIIGAIAVAGAYAETHRVPDQP